jgi:hypothetical protein
MSMLKNFASLCWAIHFMDQLKAQGKTSQVSFDTIVGQYQVEWEA